MKRDQSVETLFKLCPMCGALNRGVDAACFNCTWHGTFDADPMHVTVVVQQLRDTYAQAQPKSRGKVSRIARWGASFKQAMGILFLPDPPAQATPPGAHASKRG